MGFKNARHEQQASHRTCICTVIYKLNVVFYPVLKNVVVHWSTTEHSGPLISRRLTLLRSTYLLETTMAFTRLALALALKQQLDKPSRLRDTFTREELRRRSGKIRQGALLDPTESAFIQLFNSGHDDALVTFCGVDHSTFRELHDLFAPLFYKYTPFNTATGGIGIKRNSHRGRPRKITSVMCLGLVLAWTRTRGSLMVLSMIFGLTTANLSVWLRFARRIMVRVLKDHPKSKVRMPTDEEIQDYIQAICSKYPSLQDVWGAMDGLKLYLQRAGGPTEENKYYNGWQHDHFVNSLFLFTPDGLIRYAYFNAPGTWHDSTMASVGGVYDTLDEIYHRTSTRIVVDSAFAKEERPSMIKSHQVNFDRNGRQRQPSQVHRDATSVRQLSEWGMRGLQGSFPRLKDRIFYEERGERKIILLMVILLFNFRASSVGQNQIRSSFMRHLDRNANAYMMG